MENKNKVNLGKVMVYVMIYLGMFAMGVVAGMMLQQAITQSTLMKVADNLEGVQIDIDLNETQIVNGLMDFYTPYFEEILNESENDDLRGKSE